MTRLFMITELERGAHATQQEGQRLEIPVHLHDMQCDPLSNARAALPHSTAHIGKRNSGRKARLGPDICPAGRQCRDQAQGVQRDGGANVNEPPLHGASRLSVMRALTRPTCSCLSTARSTTLTL